MGAVKGSTSTGGNRVTYYKVVNGRNPFRVKAADGALGAESREFTPMNGGETKTFWEYRFEAIEGYLKDINTEIKEFSSGKVTMVNIILRDPEPNEPDMVLQINRNNNAVEVNGLIEKLCNADVEQALFISYYNFKSKDDDKTIKGFNVYQGEYKSKECKVYSKFYDPERGSINGIPAVTATERQSMDGDDWKSHFKRVNTFLVEYFKNVLKPKVDEFAPEEPETETAEAQTQGDARAQYEDQQHQGASNEASEKEDDDLPF